MMLPIAARLAREQNARYVYDTHELATDEYNQNWRWRLLRRPLVRMLEQSGIRGAAAVSCVSEGIANRLRHIYGLSAKPTVIRNVPRYQQVAFRSTGKHIRVLYHGMVSPGRGLEACIRSVAFWRPEFDLTIRGPCTDEYRSSLALEIQAAGVLNRVHLAPPVPMTQLVTEASAFDVGLFALPGYSRHNRYALPNKFFEYTMAGLALCVSDLPEMAHLAKHYSLGVLIPDLTPEAIAIAINGLDRASIDRYKQHALAAAKELCWEVESTRLVANCAAVLEKSDARLAELALGA